MRHLTKTLLVAAIAVASVAVAVGPAHAAETGVVVCTDETIDVDIATGHETIAGTYCRPATSDGTAEVTIAIPGATYTRWYWDPDYDRATYSFAWAAADAGHPVWAIDRLGTGASSRPASVAMTTTAQAAAITALADQLHDTGFGDTGGIDRIVLAGHSMGSATALLAAADGADIDGIIATGLTPDVRLDGLVGLLGYLLPAATDPDFDDYASDPGYVTTAPGTRDDLFYTDTADAGMIARDEAVKSVIAVTEFPDAWARVAVLEAAAHVTVPVLTLMGSADDLFCGATATDCASTTDLVKQQSPQFTASACYSAAVVPDTGHDLALHPTAPRTHALMTGWLDALDDGACPAGDATSVLG